jgi:hypothetical protein
MRGKSQPDCNVWTVLTRHSIVVGKEFIFRAGSAPIALLALLYAATSVEAPSRSRMSWRRFSIGGCRGSLLRDACWSARGILKL